MRPDLTTLAVLGLTLLLVPSAAAQLTNAQVGSFGTQTRVGDADYTPLLKSSKTWAVGLLEAGLPGIQDDCILLLHDTHTLSGVFPGQTTLANNKDIRLTPCQGKPAGSLVADGDVMERRGPYAVFPFVGAAASFSAQSLAGAPVAGRAAFAYADLDSNGRYGKGDTVYLTVGAPDAGHVLATSNGPASWTLRLTPFGSLPGGALVFPGDADWPAWRAAAKTDKAWIVGEREDKGWYLMTTDSVCCFSTLPVTAASTIRAGTPVPINALRISTPGLFTLQPSIIVTGAELANPDGAEQGKPLPVIVTMTNNGPVAGAGLIVTKLDKQIVDVRMSPLLSPGEGTKSIVTVAQVPRGGQQELEVNDVFLPIEVRGAAGAGTDNELAALQAEVAKLHERLATLEDTRGATVQKQGSPGLAPLGALGALGLVALALRRRAT